MSNTGKIFEIQKISKRDNKLLYNQILNSVLTTKSQQNLRDCLKLYINYVANRRGITGTYSFEVPKNVVDAEKLADCFLESENRAYVNLNESHFVFNQMLLTCNNFEDFAFVVQEIEHEFQHMALKLNPVPFSFENPNGLKSEFYSHKPALSIIRKHLEEKIKTTEQFNEADLTMLQTVAKVLYHFDGDEIYARLVGIEAARKFLNDMQTLAKGKNKKALKEEINKIAQSYLINEQAKNAIKEGVLKENKADMHKLLYRLFKEAKKDNDLELVSAIAETQDIAQLYNPAIFAHIESFAKQHNHLETLLHLDNCKHARPNAEKAKQHYMEYVKNHTGQISLLSNYSIETKKAWIKQASLAPVVVAKEIEETKPKRRVFGRRFKSMQEPSVQESTADLSKEVHGISHVAESFLKRRENRMSSQPKHEQNNDYYQ